MITRPLPPSVRLVILRAIVIATGVIFVAQLWRIQFIQGQGLRARADENRFRLVEVQSARGVMYDRNGQLMVRNRPSFNIVAVPAILPDDETEARLVLQRLDRIIPRSEAYLPIRTEATSVAKEGTAPAKPGDPGVEGPPRFRQRLSVDEAMTKVDAGLQGGAYRPIVIAPSVSQETAFAVAEQSYQLPGVELSIEPVREYLSGTLTSQAMGFVGPIPESYVADYEAEGYQPYEQVGLSGIELTFEKALRGRNGRSNIEVDVNGREVRTVGDIFPTAPGNNLVLTLDMKLQALMERALRKGLEAAKADTGVTIAMNPQTGEILGMVSLPTYDNNLFADGITSEEYDALLQDKRRPLLNHAISALYPPGSTFKVVTTSGALQEGVIDENTRLGDGFDGRVDGMIYVDNRFFPNDTRYAQPFYCWIHTYGTGHYRITVREALAVSCDIFMYQIAGGYRKQFEGLGIDKLVEYTKLYGFGEPTGIDLPGENPGLVPTPRWKRLTYAETWAAGDTYNMAIGQGAMLATPLQVLNATAAVANGGTLYRPQLVKKVVDTAGNIVEEFKPEMIRQLPVDPATVDIVRDGLWGAVNYPNGTAKALSVPGVEVAAKTGTAEFYDPEIPLKANKRLPTHAWFTAFAPFDNPEIAVVVFIYNGGEGSVAALPVAQEILRGYFALKNPAGLMPGATAGQAITPTQVITSPVAPITATVPVTPAAGGG